MKSGQRQPKSQQSRWLRISQNNKNRQSWQFWETSWLLASQIVISNLTDFLFFHIKIRFEMAEIRPKVAKQLATAIMGDLLVASQMASQILLIEQTNFLFYPIKIRLEMAELWPTKSDFKWLRYCQKLQKYPATAILGDQLVARWLVRLY